MNAYEAACERYEAISRSYDQIVGDAMAAIQAADDEYTAAGRNLAQYEERPGIPKPEYREQVTA